MANLALFNLIVYNLLQINLQNVIIFHCWKLTALYPLAQLFSHNSIFSQFIYLNQSHESLANFHKEYLDSELTKLGVFLDMNCAHSAFITNQSSRQRIFTHYFQWSLYDETGNMTQLVQQFENANLSINADVTYIKPAKLHNDSVFILYDVYNKGSHLGGKLNITIDQSVYCNESSCVRQHYLSDLYKRTRLQQRSDLSGITFRHAAVVSKVPINSSEDKLLEFLESENEPHWDFMSRMLYKSNVHLQELFKFNVKFHWMDQWSINDYIGGAMGELVTEAAEISSTPFVISPARLTYIFPLTDVTQFRSICIFRTPHNAGIQMGVFLAPFKPSVWLTFGCLLLFSSLLLWLIFRLEHRWTQHCLQYMPSILTSCLITFGAACIQGSYLIPHSSGGRLAFIALMLTSFLMYNYYTSIVVSTLLGSPVRSNIKTMQQLADSSLDVGFEDIGFTRVYLDSSPRADIRSLVRQKVEKHDPKSIWLTGKEGVLRVRDQPGYVFVSETTFLYTFVEKYYLPHEICELNEISFRPESALYAMIHINSTYRELLKQAMVRMLESGITSKHRLFYSKSKLHCFSNNYVINVGMEYAAPLFIALLTAYIAAILIFVIEIVWARLGRRQLQSV
ncbi:Ir75c, partial [Drosophila busckii]